VAVLSDFFFQDWMGLAVQRHYERLAVLPHLKMLLVTGRCLTWDLTSRRGEPASSRAVGWGLPTEMVKRARKPGPPPTLLMGGGPGGLAGQRRGVLRLAVPGRRRPRVG
jgi:hypothetical protein